MANFRLFTFLLLACSVVGCGGGEAPLPVDFADACRGVPGCEVPDVTVDGPPLAIWRVLVVRDGAGAVRIEEVEEIEVSASIGVPQGPLHGPLGLAALDAAGQPLEVQLIRFPTTRYIEDWDGGGDEEDLSEQVVSMVGYLEVREAADRLAIIEGEGVVEHSIPAPSPGEAVRVQETEGGSRALIQAAPSGACAHVMILDTVADAAWNPTTYPHRPPTATQRALVQAALGRMTAVHCMGVSRIAFIDRPYDTSAGSVASWEGDFLNINMNYEKREEGFEWVAFDDYSLRDPRAQALFEGVIMHEAAHATTNLLSAAASDEGMGPRGMWAPTARSLAESTIDRVRLRGDITELWYEMHESFVDRGWAESYYEIRGRAGETVLEQEARIELRNLVYASRKQDPAADIVASGFMSPYGGLNALEDIAEFATWPIADRLYDMAGVEPGPGALKRGYACPAMESHGESNVPSGLAAPFTKVTFMRDLGFITEENYQACTGMYLGLPHDTQGITVYESGDVQNTFGNSPEARIEQREDRFVFVLEARGSVDFGGMPYSATLTLEIDLGSATRNGMAIPIEEISWPRGAFAISPLTPHVFMLRLDDAPAGNFDVTDGFVLAAAASNDRLVGSVFVTEAFRYMAPIPVPQSFDPPLQFRYLLEN